MQIICVYKIFIVTWQAKIKVCCRPSLLFFELKETKVLIIQSASRFSEEREREVILIIVAKSRAKTYCERKFYMKSSFKGPKNIL